MFDAFCERCQVRLLLGPSRIVSVVNTERGILLFFRCHCGEIGVEVTGRRQPGVPVEPGLSA